MENINKQNLFNELKELEVLIHDVSMSLNNLPDDDIVKMLDMFKDHFGKMKYDYIITPSMAEQKNKLNVIAKC